MGTWKRLTRSSEGQTVDVNMDNVTQIIRYGDYTHVVFAAVVDRALVSIVVTETPDEIHARKPLKVE